MAKFPPEILAQHKAEREARNAEYAKKVVTFRMQRRNHDTWKWQDVRHKQGFILPEYDLDKSLPYVEVKGHPDMLGYMNTICQSGYSWRQL